MMFRLLEYAFACQKNWLNLDIFIHAPRQNSLPGYHHSQAGGKLLLSSSRQRFFESFSFLPEKGGGYEVPRRNT